MRTIIPSKQVFNKTEPQCHSYSDDKSFPKEFPFTFRNNRNVFYQPYLVIFYKSHNPSFSEISSIFLIGFTASSAIASSTATSGHSYFNVLYNFSIVFRPHKITFIASAGTVFGRSGNKVLFRTFLTHFVQNTAFRSNNKIFLVASNGIF